MSLYCPMPIRWAILWGLVAITVTACAVPLHSHNANPIGNHLEQLATIDLDRTQVSIGQTIYVPIYAHIYHQNRQDQIINLAATLSIRNTDPEQAILITAVRYYDTNGQFIRQYTGSAVELPPLASTDVFIQTDDLSGGTGANFMVEWVATAPVYQPVVEAVMVSTASSQGISFASSGRVLRQFGNLKPLMGPLEVPKNDV